MRPFAGFNKVGSQYGDESRCICNSGSAKSSLKSQSISPETGAFGISLAGEQTTGPANLGVHRQVCNTFLFTWISCDIQSTCLIVASALD